MERLSTSLRRLRRLRDQDRALRDRAWVLGAVEDGRRVRLWATVAVGAVALIVGDMTLREGLATVGILVANHALSTAVEVHGARHERFPTIGAIALIGIVAIFGFSCLAPEARLAALFAYVIVVAFFASVGGRLVALVASAVALTLALIREALSDRPDRIDGLTIAVFVVALISIAVMVDVVTRRQLRTARSLRRLHEALRSLSSAPDLAATLDSVVEVARQAVGATQVFVLLAENEHFVLAAPRVDPLGGSADEVEQHALSEPAGGTGSPLAATFARGRTVVVPDTLHDERFPHWSRRWGEHPPTAALRSLVSVPLRSGLEVIGVLQAYFTTGEAVDQESVRLLEAYSEQAALAIVRAQAYEQECRLTEQLTEADRLKSEFLALVSHELRTPLTAAKGFVDTVVYQWDRLDDAKRRELLARASANAEELARIIGQLLDYTRIEGDWAPLDPVPARLAEAVATTLWALGPALTSHEVVAEVPADLVVLVDVDGFGHVLSNLLTNAAKFAPAGTRITVAAADEDGEVVLTVGDEGPGIALTEQEKIFERFYQTSALRASRRGAGLGLAIARRYVDAMGGRIWVESEPGAGATFVVALRRAPGGLTGPPPTTKLDQPV